VDGQDILTLVLVLLILLWMAQLVWLWRESERRRDDPLRTVSGAAIFFVAAAPVARSAPGLVDTMARFWERVIPDGGTRQQAPEVNAYLLIQGQQRPLDQPRLRLGRYPNNEVVLDHSTVSAYHAEIIQRPDGRHEIVDRESRNGTRVNGALVRNQVLRHNDLVTLGAASLHYMSPSSSSQVVAVPQYPSRRPEEDADYWEDEQP
jgi:hypothetical protein